jgi:hypothetical protein
MRIGQFMDYINPPSAGLGAVRRAEKYSNGMSPNLLAHYLYL